LHALARRSLRPFFDGATPPRIWDDAKTHADLTQTGSCITQAQDAQGLAGFAQYCLEPDHPQQGAPTGKMIYLYHLHIRPDLRARGLGSDLLQEVRAFARDTQSARIVLTCQRLNTPARAFYARHGFRPLRAALYCDPRDIELHLKL
jgi:ribosomal protein S18 acetylase RimI-like enzyme